MVFKRREFTVNKLKRLRRGRDGKAYKKQAEYQMSHIVVVFLILGALENE